MSRHFIIFLFLLSPLVACGASKSTNYDTEKISMGPFGKKKTYVVSPPFEGRLLNDGKPLSNMKLIRRVQYYGVSDWIEETYETDDLGYFKIPIMEVKMRLSFLAQFEAATRLVVILNGQETQVWYSSARDEGTFTQFGGMKPLDFICDIQGEELVFQTALFTVVTQCNWKNLPN